MRKILAVLSLLAAALVFSVVARADDEGFITHQEALEGQIQEALGGDTTGVGPGQQGKSQTYCGTNGEAGHGVFDKDISCDDPFAPDNENSVLVDPANPNLVMVGTNDYQLNFVGSTVNEQVPSGFYLSEDGGKTWLDGNLPLKGDLGGGDPVAGWNDKYNEGVFASLSFVCGQLAPVCSRGNVMFASFPKSQLSGNASKDVINWSDQEIANGNGSDVAAQQIFLDKEWMAIDNNPGSPGYGNMYVTFTKFRFESLRYDESPIWFTMSSDGGKQWTTPQEISGRNPRYCTYQSDPNDPDSDSSSPSSTNATAEGPDDPFACDEDQFSVPVVAPNGDLYVTFQNEQNQAAWEIPQTFDDQVLVIKSTDQGKTFTGEAPTAANQAGCVHVQGQVAGPTFNGSSSCPVPVHVANLEDSNDNTSHVEGGPTAVPDFPINVNGRTTLTGFQFRYNSSSNITVAHVGGTASGAYRVYVLWADNAAGIIPGSSTTPGTVPVTNTNVYYAYSDDHGSTWAGGDQALTSASPGTPGSGPLCTTGACPELATRLAVPSAPGLPDSSNTNCGTCPDEFYPWAATNPVTGALSAGWMEGNFGVFRQQYGFAVNTSDALTLGAPPAFAGPATVISSAPSNPNNSRFFRARIAGCKNCATFIGDYNGLDVGSDGKVHAAWTDMRRVAPGESAATGNRFTQDTFYGSIPAPTP